MTNSVEQILGSARVVPVIVINKIEEAIPLANALVAGGLKVLEVTLRTPIAIEAIKEIKNNVNGAVVGSGTVINTQTLDASMEAGADFIVSPGTTSELIAAAKQNNAPLLPGVASPSEVMNLLNQGFNSLKFFPAAAAGGVNMLKSIGGPLPQATFCPTGGINLANANDYLSLPNVACVGGTWMLDKQLIADGNWEEITKLAYQASQL
ncbi:MAG: bifunctional 4-hydroxy-2-oxoglutarate aldolase/2-dehydro-3-deoxy-phosphogluconate aldolase [Kangiellaceae bacterium]|nr:bifunctional 4-hydroxy-2-oxoglutarate aldolase/2-dehydro-3-deoxy-phosphogluconate aldolase [Kangiellaceae bacterium]